MKKNGKIFLQALRGHATERNPLWLMRQAGRYLPEYRELRKQKDNFVDFCLDPKMACEASLQPIRRFQFDAAIIFSDILMVPYALGQKLEYREKEGPVLEPVRTEEDLKGLLFKVERLHPVFEATAKVKSLLSPEVAQIGFCGGLWTVACYMIDGQSRNHFKGSLSLLQHQPSFVKKLMDMLHEATLEHLCHQIEAGAEVIQIFESWAGLLSDKKFRKWIIEPTKRLVSDLQKRHPGVPVIGFPRGASPADYVAYVDETGIDALSFDENIPLSFAKENLQSEKPLQGNLSSASLVIGGEEMQKEVKKILETFGPSHLFNLGHGVLPETPVENVAQLVRWVREAEWVQDENGGYSL